MESTNDDAPQYTKGNPSEVMNDACPISHGEEKYVARRSSDIPLYKQHPFAPEASDKAESNKSVETTDREQEKVVVTEGSSSGSSKDCTSGKTTKTNPLRFSKIAIMEPQVQPATTFDAKKQDIVIHPATTIEPPAERHYEGDDDTDDDDDKAPAAESTNVSLKEASGDTKTTSASPSRKTLRFSLVPIQPPDASPATTWKKSLGRTVENSAEGTSGFSETVKREPIPAASAKVDTPDAVKPGAVHVKDDKDTHTERMNREVLSGKVDSEGEAPALKTDDTATITPRPRVVHVKDRADHPYTERLNRKARERKIDSIDLTTRTDVSGPITSSASAKVPGVSFQRMRPTAAASKRSKSEGSSTAEGRSRVLRARREALKQKEKLERSMVSDEGFSFRQMQPVTVAVKRATSEGNGGAGTKSRILHERRETQKQKGRQIATSNPAKIPGAEEIIVGKNDQDSLEEQPKAQAGESTSRPMLTENQLAYFPDSAKSMVSTTPGAQESTASNDHQKKHGLEVAEPTEPSSGRAHAGTETPGAVVVGGIDESLSASSNSFKSSRHFRVSQRGILVEATLVQDAEDDQRLNVFDEEIVIASTMKRNLLADRRCQCGIVLVLMLALGLTLWATLRPKSVAEPRFVAFSNSPSSSLVPSFTPTTSLPSVTPSSAPSGVQIKSATLTLELDTYPHETGWMLQGPCGIVAEVGFGEYTSANAVATTTFELAVGIEYVFTLQDSFGDGITIPLGTTSLVLNEDGSTLFKISGEFTTLREERFSLPGTYESTYTCSPSSVPSIQPSVSTTISKQPSQSPGPTSSPTEVIYYFHSLEWEGLCIDIDGGGPYEAAFLKATNCTYETTQLWRYDVGRILSGANSTLCVETADDSETSLLQLFPCRDFYTPQLFTYYTPFNKTFDMIRSERRSMCMRLNGLGKGIQLGSCYNETTFEPTQGWFKQFKYLIGPNVPSAAPSESIPPTQTPTSFSDTIRNFRLGDLCLSRQVSVGYPGDLVIFRVCTGHETELWRFLDGSISDLPFTNLCLQADTTGINPALILPCDPSLGDFQSYTINNQSQLQVTNTSLCITAEELAPDMLPAGKLLMAVSPDENVTVPFLHPCFEGDPDQVFDLTPVTSFPSISIVPSVSPSVSSNPTKTSQPTGAVVTRTATLDIMFGYGPSDLYWYIEGPCGLVTETLPGEYDARFRLTRVVKTYELWIGYNYVFNVTDLQGDGFLFQGRLSFSVDIGAERPQYIAREVDAFGPEIYREFTVPGVPVPLNCT